MGKLTAEKQSIIVVNSLSKRHHTDMSCLDILSLTVIKSRPQFSPNAMLLGRLIPFPVLAADTCREGGKIFWRFEKIFSTWNLGKKIERKKTDGVECSKQHLPGCR